MFCPVKFSDLYHADRAISSGIQLVVLALLFAAGFAWVTQPVPGVEPVPGPSFEREIAPYVPLFTGALAAIGLLVFLRRFLFVRSVLASGVLVKGRVEKLETTETRTNSRSATADRPIYRRTYFATISYLVNNAPYTVCIRLPNSPSVYQVFEGRETELIVLPSAPGKPLLKAVYARK